MSNISKPYQILHQNSLLTFQITQNSIQITAVTLHKPIRSFTRTLHFGKNSDCNGNGSGSGSGGLCSFLESPEEFMDIVRSQDSWFFRDSQGVLNIRWKVVWNGYQKLVNQAIVMDQSQLDQQKRLRLQILTMKKRIEIAEDASKKTTTANKTPIPINPTTNNPPNPQPQYPTPQNPPSPKPKPLKLCRKAYPQYLNPKQTSKSPQTPKSTSKAPKTPKTKPITKPPKPTPSSTHRQQQSRLNALFENLVEVDVGDDVVYVGGMKNGCMNGEGYLYSKEIGTYKGQFLRGKMHGYGTLIDIDQTTYVGKFTHNKKTGTSTQTYKNTESYIGQFVNDYKQGYGTYYFINGDKYEGEWKKDMCHGSGKEVFADGSYFVGTWVEDEKHGKGVLVEKGDGEGMGEGRRKRQWWSNGKMIRQEEEEEEEKNLGK